MVSYSEKIILLITVNYSEKIILLININIVYKKYKCINEMKYRQIENKIDLDKCLHISRDNYEF